MCPLAHGNGIYTCALVAIYVHSHVGMVFMYTSSNVCPLAGGNGCVAMRCMSTRSKWIFGYHSQVDISKLLLVHFSHSVMQLWQLTDANNVLIKNIKP